MINIYKVIKLIIFPAVLFLISCNGVYKISIPDQNNDLVDDFKAMTLSAPGAPGVNDKNNCAYNVVEQFEKAFSGDSTYKNDIHNWYFNWNKSLPEADRDPDYYFNPPYKTGNHKFDPLAYHIQGFVRTNDPVFKYAGSHSNIEGREGSVFFIKQFEGRNYLSSIHETVSQHPSGVAVLGDYLFVGDGKKIRVYDVANINNPAKKIEKTYSLPKDHSKYKLNTFGGGIGAVKLENGKILFVVSTPGGTKEYVRRNKFYLIEGTLLKKVKIKFLNEQEYIGPEKYQYSENMTLISECESGRIFAVHTGSGHSISGRGYWRLSLLTKYKKNALQFETVMVGKTSQNFSGCHLRSAATAYVNSEGVIEYYCHEYLNNPDFGDWDSFNFKRIHP
ncbi:MAG: hypothetical protein JXR91_03045 [Deltaproteobacteria bacterium]|nr:hypothetical protein [Deltaproteobacteria bacterium]